MSNFKNYILKAQGEVANIDISGFINENFSKYIAKFAVYVFNEDITYKIQNDNIIISYDDYEKPLEQKTLSNFTVEKFYKFLLKTHNTEEFEIKNHSNDDVKTIKSIKDFIDFFNKDRNEKIDDSSPISALGKIATTLDFKVTTDTQKMSHMIKYIANGIIDPIEKVYSKNIEIINNNKKTEEHKDKAKKQNDKIKDFINEINKKINENKLNIEDKKTFFGGATELVENYLFKDKVDYKTRLDNLIFNLENFSTNSNIDLSTYTNTIKKITFLGKVEIGFYPDPIKYPKTK